MIIQRKSTRNLASWLLISLLAASMSGCGEDNSTESDSTSDAAICGNGIRETGEVCDDGETSNEGTCLADCSGSTSCGDGVVQTSEDCDDGNKINDDACTNRCMTAVHGDGIVQALLNEECDDGNRVTTDECTNDGRNAICGDGIIWVGVEACDNSKETSKCTVNCTFPTCGDGEIQGEEECDDGNQNNTDSCLNTCIEAICGDGYIQAGVETCDDGNANSDRAACLSTCERAECGDGFVQIGVEACDDGGETDACSAVCTLTSCGDGVIQASEECDEGAENSNAMDATCTTHCTKPRCGDQIVQNGEDCDDGNDSNADSCLNSCVKASCGDGYINLRTKAVDINKDADTDDPGETIGAAEECDLGDDNGDNSSTGWCTSECAKQCSATVASSYTDVDISDAEYARWNDVASRAVCYISMGDADQAGDIDNDEQVMEVMCPEGTNLIVVDNAAEFTLLQTILGVPQVNSQQAWISCPSSIDDYAAWDTLSGEPNPTGSPDTVTGSYNWGTSKCFAYHHATNGWRWYSTVADTFESTDSKTYICEIDKWEGGWDH